MVWNGMKPIWKTMPKMWASKSLDSPFCAYSVDLVYENNWRSVFLSHSEELSHKFGTIAQVFLNKLWAHHSQEGGRRLVRHCFCQKSLACTPRICNVNILRNRLRKPSHECDIGLRPIRLTCSWCTVQNDPFGWLYSHLFIILWMCEGKLHRLL